MKIYCEIFKSVTINVFCLFFFIRNYLLLWQLDSNLNLKIKLLMTQLRKICDKKRAHLSGNLSGTGSAKGVTVCW